ncbi:MAG: family 43 glycosylhydrolase [Muribaculaceae bacterium]|nr:family 43 glycosylhydrolase [Muribaculaceae bacterium]MBR1725116.1 family 43 glycosylhydrolase [Muribaculaceae bacterium]
MRIISLHASIVTLAVTLAAWPAQSGSIITPGLEWEDTNGSPINAHGGGVMYHDGVYYWYGEYKGDFTYRSPGVGWDCYRTEAGGVSCYSSRDLCNWTFEGIVLEPDTVDTHSDIHPTMVIERPKVVYNDRTHQFVMWMHIDNHNYGKATAGVAVSDTPTGKFRFIEAMRPNGQICRDLTVFKDDDDQAYLIYSSEDNATLHIARLSDDYLKPTAHYTRNFPNGFREAPAMFKRQGKYYLVTSGCTGWDPNEADLAVADQVMGPYTPMGNPCRGVDADKTFYGQSTFVIAVEGTDQYVMMLDRWNKRDLIASRYIWLPFEWSDGKPSIPWRDVWAPNTACRAAR